MIEGWRLFKFIGDVTFQPIGLLSGRNPLMWLCGKGHVVVGEVVGGRGDGLFAGEGRRQRAGGGGPVRHRGLSRDSVQ